MHLTRMSILRARLRAVVSAGTMTGLIAVIAAGIASPPALAEDPADPLSDLRQRIEKLERDNSELRAALNKQPSPSIEPLVPPSPDGSEEESEDERRIGSLVEKYIRRLQSQPQPATPLPSPEDSVQDQRIGMLENNISGLMKRLNAPRAAIGNFGGDGLFFTSTDGNFKNHVGAVVQWDYIGMGPSSGVTSPNVFGLQDSVTARRLRLRGEGTMYEHFDYVFECDFALALQNYDTANPGNPFSGLQGTTANGGSGLQGGNTGGVMQPTTIFITAKDIPVLGNMRIGNQQSWFSMEHIESARFLDFMERAPIMDAFSGANNNGYAPGVSVFNNTPDKNAGLQLGFYKNNVYDSGYAFDMGNAWTLGGRAIWTPYYDEETKGRYLVHTGFGSEYRTMNRSLSAQDNGTNIRIRSRGDLRNASSTIDPNYADTGNFYAENQLLFDPELVVQYGSLLLRAEYCASLLQGARPFQGSAVSLGDHVFMYGGYAEALYFLTGENRDYNRVSGVFNRVIPKNNANFSECHYGAWQVGVRYDYLNVNSRGINGGQNQDGTFGINWFLNPNLRFQCNYVLSWVNNAGPSGIVATNGALVGAKFVGDGLIQSVGTRIDWTY